MRPHNVRTNLQLTLITKHLKMTLLMCYRGGEGTVVYFPILLRLPELSSPSLHPEQQASETSPCAGYVIQERRNQPKPSTVDDVLFMHSNLKHHAKHEIV